MKGHTNTWQTYNKLMHEDTISWAVLWLVCRHHIGELHVKHVDIHIRGPREDSFKTNSTKIISPD